MKDVNFTCLVCLIALVPPLLGQDRPLEIVMDPPARYPTVIGPDETPTGSVTLVIGVSPRGELLDTLVTAYTHTEFAHEVRRAAELWTYRPAIVGGEAIGARQEIYVEFEPDHMVRQLTPVNTMERRFEKVVPKKVTQVYVRERDLDSPLALTNAPTPPTFKLEEDNKVTVDFYVDQEGKTRLPVIVSMDEPLLAESALDTIKEWRFVPPTHNGKPVITRARQQFVFHGGADEDANAATGS